MNKNFLMQLLKSLSIIALFIVSPPLLASNAADVVRHKVVGDINVLASATENSNFTDFGLNYSYVNDNRHQSFMNGSSLSHLKVAHESGRQEPFNSPAHSMLTNSGVVNEFILQRELIQKDERICQLEKDYERVVVDRDRRIVREIEDYKRRQECDRGCRQTPPASFERSNDRSSDFHHNQSWRP